MRWSIEFDLQAAKEFKKLDKPTKQSILNYLTNKVLKGKHPADLGKPLKYGYIGLWRYVLVMIQALALLNFPIFAPHVQEVHCGARQLFA